MQVALQILLTLIQSLLPSIIGNSSSTSATIDKILAALIQLIPLISAAETTVITSVKTMISAITTSGAATPAQLKTLQMLDAEVDKAFEDAVSAYLANHPTAGVTAQAPAAGGLDDYVAPADATTEAATGTMDPTLAAGA